MNGNAHVPVRVHTCIPHSRSGGRRRASFLTRAPGARRARAGSRVTRIMISRNYGQNQPCRLRLAGPLQPPAHWACWTRAGSVCTELCCECSNRCHYKCLSSRHGPSRLRQDPITIWPTNTHCRAHRGNFGAAAGSRSPPQHKEADVAIFLWKLFIIRHDLPVLKAVLVGLLLEVPRGHFCHRPALMPWV